MKAIRFHEFGPPEVLRYADLPDPEPRFGEVRISVRAATVNRTLDVLLRRGSQQWRDAVLPCIPGVDCAGVIDAVGPGVTRWAPGDRVATAGIMPLEPVPDDDSPYTGALGMMGIKRPGGFAELVCVPARMLIRLPDALDFHTAAVTMRHVPTAWNLMVNVSRLRADEWVLVMGASGNLGTLGIQIAKRVVGAKVIAAAGTAARARIGLELGADAAVDYGSTDIYDEVMRITANRGIDVLYDNIANPKVLPHAFRTLRMNGRLVTAGAHGGPEVTIDFQHLYDRRITIFGMPGRQPADDARCFQAVADGTIAVRIEHVLPLAAVAEAHRMMEADPGCGKIVLDPTLR